jgi:peptide/nickel transport system permease protein
MPGPTRESNSNNSALRQGGEEHIPPGRSLWADGIRRLRKQRLAVVCFWIIVVYFGLAAFEWMADAARWKKPAWTQWDEIVGPSYQKPMVPYEWTKPDGTTEIRREWMGTDFLGRSTFRRTLYGAKTSITVALFASLISLAIGVPLGAAAGYFRGWIDELVVWLLSTLSTVPYLLLLMAFAVVLRDKTVFGLELRGITSVYLAMGLTSWVGICRLIRGEFIKRKESEYVLAARATGCSHARIIFSHLLPNVFHIIIIDLSLRFVSFIHAEVILSFLGLGETDKPSWGAMIDAARAELARDVWWEMTAATIAIFLLSLALNLFGDALRDCLDPKLRVD